MSSRTRSWLACGALTVGLLLTPGRTRSACAQDEAPPALVSADEAAILEASADDVSERNAGRPLLRLTARFQRDRGEHGTGTRLKASVNIPIGSESEVALGTERDPGEPVRWKPSEGWYGPDHASGYMHLRRSRGDRAFGLIAGRYRVSFGHGLLLGSGTAPVAVAGRPGRSPGVRSGARGYAGYSERPTPNGILVTAGFRGGMRLGAFASTERASVSVENGPGGSSVVQDVSTSGLHDSESALERRARIRTGMAGGWLVFEGRRFSIGALGIVPSVGSSLPLSSTVREASRARGAIAAAYSRGGCELSSEVVLRSGTAAEAIGRCRVADAHFFAEWHRESRGPAALYGRQGRLVRENPSVDRLRAGWRHRLTSRSGASHFRLAVSAFITQPLSADRADGFPHADVAYRQKGLRATGELERGPFVVSAAVRVRRKRERPEFPLILGSERLPAGLIRGAGHETSTGLSLTIRYTFATGTSVQLGHLMALTAADRPDERVRRTTGTSAAVRISRRRLNVSFGALATDGDECAWNACDGPSAPRVYVHEYGVSNAFGIASSGQDGMRWYWTVAAFPHGRVVFEMQMSRRALLHADLDARRAARIGAPPARSVYTFQVTFR